MLSPLRSKLHCTGEDREAQGRAVTCRRSGSRCPFNRNAQSTHRHARSLNAPWPYGKHVGWVFHTHVFTLFYHNVTFRFLKPCPFPPQHSILGLFSFLVSHQVTLRYLVLRQHLGPAGPEGACCFSLAVRFPLCFFLFPSLPLFSPPFLLFSSLPLSIFLLKWQPRDWPKN